MLENVSDSDEESLRRAIKDVCEGKEKGNCRKNPITNLYEKFPSLTPSISFGNVDGGVCLELFVYPDNGRQGGFFITSIIYTNYGVFELSGDELLEIVEDLCCSSVREEFNNKILDYACELEISNSEGCIEIENKLSESSISFDENDFKEALLKSAVGEDYEEFGLRDEMKFMKFPAQYDDQFSFCIECGVAEEPHVSFYTPRRQSSPFSLCVSCVDSFLSKHYNRYNEGDMMARII